MSRPLDVDFYAQALRQQIATQLTRDIKHRVAMMEPLPAICINAASDMPSFMR